MVPAAVPAPLEGFKRLNAATYIYEPLTINTTSSSSASSTPDLILLPSWLDAAPRHIAKYTRGYQALYPHARILLLTTVLADITIRTRSAEAARLAPALSILLLTIPSSSPNGSGGGGGGGILLHSFSNGGAYTAHLLARLYHARTGHALPIQAQILDSAPGIGGYRRSVTALTTGLPQRPLALRYASLLLLHLFLVTYWLVKKASGTKNKIEVMREGLLDQTYWDLGTPRCYVFSRGDEMVVWRDVVEHAGRSEGAGWKRVSREEFVGSRHCAHLLVDEKRYWGVVERVWGER